MSASTPHEAALLAHVLGQMHSHVQFLLAQNYITNEDANMITERLPGHVVATTKSSITMTAPAPFKRATPAPPAPGPTTFQVRAMWAYNESGSESDDLSFKAGDIIEVMSEVNDDWWLGRVNDREALFPSAYVERLATPAPAAPAPATAVGRRLPPALPVGFNNEKPVYKPFGAALNGVDAPPANGNVNSVGLQQDPEQEKKKSKFGKYGNTMAHSAAGGVGFGAGAAIGGGLVRAIF